MNKLKICIVSFLLFQTSVINAQNKFHILMDYQYNYGLLETNDGIRMTHEENYMCGHALHLTGMYDFTNKIPPVPASVSTAT